jgi:hypothetical protein
VDKAEETNIRERIAYLDLRIANLPLWSPVLNGMRLERGRLLKQLKTIDAQA